MGEWEQSAHPWGCGIPVLHSQRNHSYREDPGDKIITSRAVKHKRSMRSSRVTGQSLLLLSFILVPRFFLQCSAFLPSQLGFGREEEEAQQLQESVWLCQGPGRCWGREFPVPTKPWQTGREFPAGIPTPWAADPFGGWLRLWGCTEGPGHRG